MSPQQRCAASITRRPAVSRCSATTRTCRPSTLHGSPLGPCTPAAAPESTSSTHPVSPLSNACRAQALGRHEVWQSGQTTDKEAQMQKFVDQCGGEWRVMNPLSALPTSTSPLTPIFRRMSLQLGMTAYWWRSIGYTMLWLGYRREENLYALLGFDWVPTFRVHALVGCDIRREMAALGAVKTWVDYL